MRLSAVPRPMSWFYARTLYHVDRAAYSVTRGRGTFTSWITGLPVVMLTTTGARSDPERRVELLREAGIEEEGDE
jgi:hypothetical protein